MTTRQPHGVPGQVNVYVLDKDSDITGLGKHNRLLVFMDRGACQIEIREDDIGLGWSDLQQQHHVACRTFQRMHPPKKQLVFRSTVCAPDGKCRWHHYDVKKRVSKQDRA